jgi:hypothetical protein
LDKTIDTLVVDIQDLLDKGIENIPEEKIREFEKSMSNTVVEAIKPRSSGRRDLRMSSIGNPCIRKLWLEYNYPERIEQLTPDTRLKFGYGHLTEEFLLFLAELAGHRVEGRQDTQEIAGVYGHRDAVIDGVVVDVKSASTYSFNKFRQHLTTATDNFGYLTQLQSYLHAGQLDDKVTDKQRGAFLVCDKTLGHICLDVHAYEPYDWETEYERRKSIVYGEERPSRSFDPIPEGKSGNYKLPVNCSYCSVKHLCHTNLRTFAYSTGPVFLTKVVREPNVPEILTEEYVTE